MRKTSLIVRAAVLSACSSSEAPQVTTSQSQTLQCAKDTDCKGDRICDGGTCKNPPSATQEATVASPGGSQSILDPLASDSNAQLSQSRNEKEAVDSGLPEMMTIYNNPKLAPQVHGCKGNTYCNAFIALASQWRAIPDSYRYHGEYDIKASAKDGVTYDDQGRNVGLHSGFYFQTEMSQKLIDGADAYVETEKQATWNHESGLAVLLYIEDKNGWSKE